MTSESMTTGPVLELSLYAADLAAAERFYVDVMGLEVTSRFDDAVAFRCGEQVLLVFDPERSNAAGRRVPPHGATGAGHVAFVADAQDLPGWRAKLDRHGVEVEAEVPWSAGVSIYFRDPAGNLLELAPRELWGHPY